MYAVALIGSRNQHGIGRSQARLKHCHSTPGGATFHVLHSPGPGPVVVTAPWADRAKDKGSRGTLAAMGMRPMAHEPPLRGELFSADLAREHQLYKHGT